MEQIMIDAPIYLSTTEDVLFTKEVTSSSAISKQESITASVTTSVSFEVDMYEMGVI